MRRGDWAGLWLGILALLVGLMVGAVMAKQPPQPPPDQGAPAAPVTAEQIAEFARYWQSRSVCIGFPQVWVDTETGETVDFAAIADRDDLTRASDRAERQYLEQYARLRQQALAEAALAARRKVYVDFERMLCQTDLYYLAKYVLGYTDMAFHLHYFMAETMASLPDGYRGLREFPRGSFKTTVMGIGWIVQEVLNDPDVAILYTSYAEDNAANKIKEAKAHFIDDRREVRRENCSSDEAYAAADTKRHPLNAGRLGIKALFPEHVPQTVAQQGSDKKWTTPAKTSKRAEATFTAAGGLTTKTSQHYDILIGDDFWNEKSVTRPEIMAKIRDALAQLEYLLANQDTGKIVFIGTRFAHDDLTTDLLKDPAYRCVIASGITPATGRPLFPERQPLVRMYAQSRTNHYQFSCQIILWPSAADQSFQREWFQYAYTVEDVRRLEREGKVTTETVLLTDASGTKSSESDHAAIIPVIKVNDGDRGFYVVAEVLHEPMGASAWLKQCFTMFDKWQARYVVRQNVALESALMTFVDDMNKERLREGKRRLRFVDYSLHKKSKRERMAALQPMYQQGRLYHAPGALGVGELEDEILKFPHNTTRDDCMDALAEILDPAVGKLPHHSAVIPDPRTPEQRHVDAVRTLPPHEFQAAQNAREYHRRMERGGWRTALRRNRMMGA